MHAGLLPVKSPARAKSRLSERYDPSQRVQIAAALIDDAFRLCADSRWLQWWVVSDDPDVLVRAREEGFNAVADGGTGLNDALATGIEAVLEAGAVSVTIVPADVPLGIGEDLRDVVDTGDTSDVVVVPSHDGNGTNALHVRPPGAIVPSFGPGSLTAHAEAAAHKGLRCTLLAVEGLELDIDTPADVDALKASHTPPKSRTLEVVRSFE